MVLPKIRDGSRQREPKKVPRYTYKIDKRGELIDTRRRSRTKDVVRWSKHRTWPIALGSQPEISLWVADVPEWLLGKGEHRWLLSKKCGERFSEQISWCAANDCSPTRRRATGNLEERFGKERQEQTRSNSANLWNLCTKLSPATCHFHEGMFPLHRQRRAFTLSPTSHIR